MLEAVSSTEGSKGRGVRIHRAFRTEWRWLKRRGIDSVRRRVSQEFSHVGHAGVEVVSL